MVRSSHPFGGGAPSPLRLSISSRHSNISPCSNWESSLRIRFSSRWELAFSNSNLSVVFPKPYNFASGSRRLAYSELSLPHLSSKSRSDRLRGLLGVPFHCLT